MVEAWLVAELRSITTEEMPDECNDRSGTPESAGLGVCQAVDACPSAPQPGEYGASIRAARQSIGIGLDAANDPDVGSGPWSVRSSNGSEWRVNLPAHHDRYITWEEFLGNQDAVMKKKPTAVDDRLLDIQAFVDGTRGQITIGEIPPIRSAVLAAVGKKVRVALLMAVLAKRFGRYGLTLHPQRTRLVDFRAPWRLNSVAGERRPAGRCFDMLGFTHFWVRSRKGRWVVTRKRGETISPCGERIAQWCRQAMHWPLSEQQAALNRKLQGTTGSTSSRDMLAH